MMIKTFDGHDINDGTNFVARFPADSGVWGLPRRRVGLVRDVGRGPLVSGVSWPGRVPPITIEACGGDIAVKRNTLMGWLDVDEPKVFVVTDSDGVSNERYVEAIPTQVVPHDALFTRMWTVLLQVSGDLKWRSTVDDTDSWSITASGQTKVVANNGDADAFPLLTLEPTTGNASGYAYRRWIPFRWRAALGATSYPLELSDGGFDTAALVSGGKAQADGDDFRVQVDGSEVDRWFGSGSSAFNQATTKIWSNLDWSADVPMTLKTAIAGSGDVDSVEVNEDISALPSAGIVVIGSEAFVFTSKSDADKSLNNTTRAQKGTSMAAHNVSDNVYWIQHDIFWLYGDAGASAPTIDDDYEPSFELDLSTNGNWVYEEFGENDGKRTAAWVTQILMGSPAFYTDTHAANTDPWVEVGVDTPSNTIGQWYLYNSCGITNANFTNGEKKTANRTQWNPFGMTYVGIFSSANGSAWDEEYAIPAPAANDTWEAWSRNEALSGGKKYVALRVGSLPGYAENWTEAADCTITLNASYTPTLMFTGAETGNYVFLPVILNQTTGLSISLDFNTDLNEEVEIDTYAKTVTDKRDDSSIFNSLTVVGDPRDEWLALQPGNNTLRYTDAGTGNVTMTLAWAERRR